MKKRVLAVALIGALSLPAMAANVASGAAVTNTGAGFGAWSSVWGSGTLASLATVTDGVFLPVNQTWNVDTVFWSGTAGGDPTNYVTVTLGATALVNSIVLQADNNDRYLVQYLDSASTWQDLVTASEFGTYGMNTRDLALATPVTTSAFRIQASAGDGWYSVSEFQAMGSYTAPVPEPETYGMMMAGLGLLGLVARRKQSA